jgi:hypothetical protein
MFGALSVFGRRIKRMITLQHEHWTWNVTRHHYLQFPLVFIRDDSVWKSGANL